MATTSDDEHTAATIGEPTPYAATVVIEDYNPQWPSWYSAEHDAICAVLGPRVLRLEHTGSTAVPGLAARPVIDIVLVIADTTDEAAYVPALESIGYRLTAREPGWYEHRFLIRRVERGRLLRRQLARVRTGTGSARDRADGDVSRLAAYPRR